jgi:hypothetical protein
MTRTGLGFAGRAAAKEIAVQATIARALEIGLPQDAYFTAIPGGDGRATRTPGYRAGTPDLIVIYRGRTLFLELKRPIGGRVSIQQAECHRAIERAGARIHVARDLAEVVELIRDELQCPVNLRVTA